MEQILQVVVQTWDKQNYELYDYESALIKVNTLQIEKNAIICRNLQNNSTKMFKSFQEDCKCILVVHSNYNQFVIGTPKHFKLHDNLEDDLWITVRPQKLNRTISVQERPQSSQNELNDINDQEQQEFFDTSNQYLLKEGDIIKLGKKELSLLKINHILTKEEIITTPHCNITQELLRDQYDSVLDNGQSFVNQNACRICLSTSYNKENPLISPCSCNGSMKFVHLICLQFWINSKIQQLQHPYHYEIRMNQTKCELCSNEFPPTITFNDKIYQLFDIQYHNDTPNALLKDINTGFLYLLNFKKLKTLQFGRGHDCHVILNEITVSRTHMQLSYHAGKIYVQDLNSKFGTLIKVQHKIQIKTLRDDNSLELQSGRTRISVQLKKKSSGWFNGLCSFFYQ